MASNPHMAALALTTACVLLSCGTALAGDVEDAEGDQPAPEVVWLELPGGASPADWQEAMKAVRRLLPGLELGPAVGPAPGVRFVPLEDAWLLDVHTRTAHCGRLEVQPPRRSRSRKELLMMAAEMILGDYCGGEASVGLAEVPQEADLLWIRGVPAVDLRGGVSETWVAGLEIGANPLPWLYLGLQGNAMGERAYDDDWEGYAIRLGSPQLGLASWIVPGGDAHLRPVLGAGASLAWRRLGFWRNELELQRGSPQALGVVWGEAGVSLWAGESWRLEPFGRVEVDLAPVVLERNWVQVEPWLSPVSLRFGVALRWQRFLLAPPAP